MLLDTGGGDSVNTRLGLRPTGPSREDSNASFGMSGLGVHEENEDEEATNDPRAWLKVIDAYQQPRLLYNVQKKHFERSAPLSPYPKHTLTLFQRYNETITPTARLPQNIHLPQPLPRNPPTAPPKRSLPSILRLRLPQTLHQKIPLLATITQNHTHCQPPRSSRE